MNHAELLCQPKQTFRVPHEKISGRIQAMPKLFNQTLLLSLVEVNHHVATEDHVVAAGHEIHFYVVEGERKKIFLVVAYVLLFSQFFLIKMATGGEDTR